jgi:multicomponent Na+:H+ antiporter subunit D
VGIASWSPVGLAASILYLLHHMLVITTLFLVSGLFLRQRRTTDLRALGGLFQSQPLVACLAMVPLFSLAGVPPLSGFIAKLALVGALLDADQYWVAGVALVVSLLTVVSMAGLWDESFWKPAPASPFQARLGPAIIAPIALLVGVTLGLTAAAGPVYGLSMRAAEQLLDPGGYVRSVLGEEAARAAR